MYRNEDSGIGNPPPEDETLGRLQNYWKYRLEEPRFELTDEHYKDFEASGITRETTKAARIFSTPNGSHTQSLLNNQSTEICRPAWFAPHFDPGNNCVYVVAKPDIKRSPEHKYEVPYNIKPPSLYFPCDTYARLQNPDTPFIIITEGVKKTLAAWQHEYCCIGLPGVAGWNKPRCKRKLHSDLQRILPSLKKIGRVVICFDSDAAYNENVQAEEKKLAAALKDAGLIVGIGRIPDSANDPSDKLGAKVGLDDLLMREDGPDELRRIIADAFAEPAELPYIGETQALDLARGFLGNEKTPKLAFGYAGAFWEWEPTRGQWTQVEQADLECQIRDHLNTHYSRVVQGNVREVSNQLQSLVKLPRRVRPPMFIGEISEDLQGLEHQCVFAANMILHLPTIRTIVPDPAAQFNTLAVDVHWNPDAPKPQRFLQFLDEAFGKDARESKLLLQEIFGYLLTPDTRRQKIFAFLGPPGCGKGTIVRLLFDLLGEDNADTTSLRSLAGEFGTQTLIGKSLVAINEIRLSERNNMNEAVNLLLSISGEDSLKINRKGLPHVTCKLNARILLSMNQIPVLPDSAGALKRRLVALRFSQSCEKPDGNLQKKFRDELAGILNWAIEGALRLQQQGDFTKLPLDEDEISVEDQLVEAGSPVSVFIHQCCEHGPELKASTTDLYDSWKIWCELNGELAGTKSQFCQKLYAASGLRPYREPRGEGPKRGIEVRGMGLRVSRSAQIPEGSEQIYSIAKRRIGRDI